jgi:anti-sigma-K factor RskA
LLFGMRGGHVPRLSRWTVLGFVVAVIVVAIALRVLMPWVSLKFTTPLVLAVFIVSGAAAVLAVIGSLIEHRRDKRGDLEDHTRRR